MNHNKRINRRQFISSAAAAAAGGTLLLSGRSATHASQTEKSRVVLVRDPSLLDENGAPRPEVVLAMMDSAIVALTAKPDVLSAWKTIIKPDDVVGIKTNVWRYISTTAAVEQSLKKRLMDAGVAENRIGIDDRGVLANPIFQNATALINARPMRTHHWAGVGSLIKNYIMFIPDPSVIHPDSCADLASIWNLPAVKGKTRLNILVMFTPQFHSVGPHNFNPAYVRPYHGLLLGFDPVAVDATGLRIIEAMRRDHFAEERSLNPPAKHITVADSKYGLGTSDPHKIDLIKIGYDKNSFI